MKMGKITLTILGLIALIVISKAQDNCYNVIADMSGFNTEPYQEQLETAASELVQAFPTEFQYQFKVYDFGFYSLTENFQGGFQAVWDNIVIPSIESPYYLLFGKQSDSKGIYTKFWVKVKLPTTNNFSCFEQDFFDKVEFQVKKTTSDEYEKSSKTPSYYAASEIEGMQKLKEWVIDIVNCCEPVPTLRSPCSLCSWTYEDILDYYSDGEFELSDCSISQSVPPIDSLCICFGDYETISQKNEGNNYEVELVTNLNEFTLDTNSINIDSLYASLVELGKLYGDEGKSFYGAITDQSIFCASIPVVAMRSSTEISTHREINQKFNSAQKGIWIAITYTNNIAKYAIKTKGIDLLVENTGVSLYDILDYVGKKKEKVALEGLYHGVHYGHFHPTMYKYLFQLVRDIDENFDEDPVLHRMEYIVQIDKIAQFLSHRHTDYGEAAQYLNNLLEPLTYEEFFTGHEVCQVYRLAVDWYLECKGRTIVAIFSEFIKAAKPFIEMALIESGFVVFGQVFAITANASWKITSLLPQSVKNTAQLIWNRITFTSVYRPNSLIPETFKLTTKSSEKFYVQYSGTEHLHELVALRGGAATKPWFESQKALRSQLVLDDFARAVDDIVTKNPNLIMDKLYTASKWEVKFGAPSSSVQSDGLRRIYHAQPIPQ
jgi:hypothetical protein